LIDGEEVLTTTWLLTKDTKPEDNWQAMLIDKATFRMKSDILKQPTE
jgi:hypothetical protein